MHRVYLSERGEGATPPGIARVGRTTATADYEEGGDSARGGGWTGTESGRPHQGKYSVTSPDNSSRQKMREAVHKIIFCQENALWDGDETNDKVKKGGNCYEKITQQD